MMTCFFVSDLHGNTGQYRALFSRIGEERPRAVFIGGDLFPGFNAFRGGDFLDDFLASELTKLKDQLGRAYPRIFLILGNDDSKLDEEGLVRWEMQNQIWEYIHARQVKFESFTVLGYNYVPPTPFQNKDWERYDISRYVDPGCIPPEEGRHSTDIPLNQIQFATIKQDLDLLAGEIDHAKSIFLFHAPPYQTNLDRAALEGKKIDHVPLDPNVGSIAVRDFILKRQPLLTLHGHVHESPRLTGSWRDEFGRTQCFSAAHDGPELALVRFSLEQLENPTRELIPPI